MADTLVRILDGNTFAVSDERGDIEASPTEPTGLFAFDTRFLSRWVLTIGGTRLTTLSVDDDQYFAARFFLVAADVGIGRRLARRGRGLAGDRGCSVWNGRCPQPPDGIGR